MHEARPRVLVTGASIGGPALAWGLARQGFEPVLLERSPRRREAGQNIDVRGLGREVLRRMGIEEQVMKNLTGEAGTRFIDPSGRAYAQIPATPGHDGPTAEVEILRGALAEILLDQITDDVEVRYGDRVTGVVQDDTGIDVELESGGRERYAALVVAEGRSSSTRRALLAGRTRMTDKGNNVAYGTIDRTSDDNDWWSVMATTQGRVAMIRPDNLGSMRASLTFPTPTIGFETLPFDAQMQVLRERYRGVSALTDRILDGFAVHPDELYAERTARVQMTTWSSGRVAVLGDAAWGSGPTGMGTTLCLVGAHVLAGEMGQARDNNAVGGDSGGDIPAAFARYQRLLWDYVDAAQSLPPGLDRISHPNSQTGVAALRVLHRLVASPSLSRITERTVITAQRNEPDLPDYPRLRP